VPQKEEYRKGQEVVFVDYIPTQRSTVVSSVWYKLGWNAIETSRFKEAALVRYGHPTVPGNSQMMYCSAGEVSCSPVDFPQPTQEPFVRVDPPDHGITLGMGAKRWREYEASIKAEMNRRAPKIGKPTF
jgi:hypothetical protein